MEGRKEKHNPIQSLCYEIESFLIFGPIVSQEEEEERPLTFDESSRLEIKKSLDELHLKHSEFHTNQEQINENLAETKQKAEELQTQLSDNDFQNSLENYLKTKYKLQLFTLAKAMKELESCSNVLEIPSIILRIKSKIPKVIPDRSKIKQYVQAIIQNKKKMLLDKFYLYFEEQFQETNTLHDTDTYDINNNNSNSVSNWEIFLQRSRNWLLAYTLISILLSIFLMESPQLILEHFQDSLDTALTPLWGRFYYHLQISLESKSKQQILWTFYYSKSFIEMLFNLIITITVSQELKQLYEINYLLAAKNQIIEKSIKFLKAHIASIFVLEFLPWKERVENDQNKKTKEKYVLQIIEEILDLDSWLLTYATEQTALGMNSNTIEPGKPQEQHQQLLISRKICLTEVIYESKEIFHYWLFLERGLILEKIQSFIHSYELTFSLVSPTSTSSSSSTARSLHTPSAHPNLHHENNRLSPSANSSSESGLKCYHGPYECLSLFLLFSQRYSLFPLQAQQFLSQVILEPLLNFLLGLLLYRIRSVKLLFQISINTFINKYPFNENIQEFSDFLDVVNYLMVCLRNHSSQKSMTTTTQTTSSSSSSSSSQKSTSFPRLTMIGNSARCRKKWTIIQNWIPKILITNELKGFTLTDLMKISFKKPEKFSNQENLYEYRSMKSLHSANVGNEPDDEIEESVKMVVELAQTLTHVLQDHFKG
jgi:hypothetical protein